MKNGPFNTDAFADAILDKRMRDGITLRVMCEQTGVNLASCRRAEMGTVIDVNLIAKICNWLDIQVQTFFTPNKIENDPTKKPTSKKRSKNSDR